MTGEVAFGLAVWLIEALALRNSMQFSEQGGGKGEGGASELSKTQLRKGCVFWGVQLLPVFHVLLHDDQARSQEKEKER